MKKSILITIILLFIVITANAQLRVGPSGNVGIMTSSNTNSRLTVGSSYNGGSVSAGITSSPQVTNNTNIGVEGFVSAESSNTNDRNYGVLGIISPINNTHGRNYGVCGMLGLSGQNLKGAGVYGANSTSYYSNPTNIQGLYAGYFDGPVHVVGSLTATSLFTASGNSLSNNLISLSERDNGGKTTLENVLNMNVLEFNMKNKLSEEMPNDIDSEKAEEVKKSYEYIKKKEEEMASKRHFGVDAEELQKLYPDLVMEGEDGNLSVNYSEIVPLLIRSIQALKQELDEVKSMRPKARKATSTTGVNASTASGNILYQNTPNPFKEQTVIRFKLAEGAQDASVCIFDMTGKLLKKLPVSSGTESVSIGGYELGEGIFLYSLIFNGQEIDTKRMIISK